MITRISSMTPARYSCISSLRPSSSCSALSPTLLPISVCGPCRSPTPNWPRCSSARPLKAVFPQHQATNPWSSYLFSYLDASNVLHPGVGDLWRADVHGHDGVLPAFAAAALGLVPKQVLQGRRVPVRASLCEEVHPADEEVEREVMYKSLAICMLSLGSRLLYSIYKSDCGCHPSIKRRPRSHCNACSWNPYQKRLCPNPTSIFPRQSPTSSP